MKDFWDKRYTSKQYVYGEQPNEYVKYAIDNKILYGKTLFPAEGEGRNAVYAAQQGLDVLAFDISTEAQNKALKLAANKDVEINYIVGDFMDVDLDKYTLFDSAALIYAHFPEKVRAMYHQHIANHIKQGGTIVLEAFSKEHIRYQKENPTVGGPQNPEMLYTKDMIVSDFSNFDIIELDEKEISLVEGIGHNGKAKVIRYIGKKR